MSTFALPGGTVRMSHPFVSLESDVRNQSPDRTRFEMILELFVVKSVGHGNMFRFSKRETLPIPRLPAARISWSYGLQSQPDRSEGRGWGNPRGKSPSPKNRWNSREFVSMSEVADRKSTWFGNKLGVQYIYQGLASGYCWNIVPKILFRGENQRSPIFFVPSQTPIIGQLTSGRFYQALTTHKRA